MSTINTDPDLITNVLDRLEHPSIDEYIIAFGPEGKQFLATSNGYSATYLPSKLLAELAGCDIKRVIWASFGSTAESWFFAYEFKNGAITFRFGESVPRALREYVDNFGAPKYLEGTLRVQLGHNGSFVVWSRTSWACYGVPEDLRLRLCRLSSGTRDGNEITMGSLKKGTLIQVQWNQDGSFYLQSSSAYARWFEAQILREAWKNLWPGLKGGMLSPEHIAEIAHVAIDGHSSTSETFALVKKQKSGEETPFILHFGQEEVHARLPETDYSLLPIDPTKEYSHFRWALCIKSGRPHGPTQDKWELNLKKGQRVKVLESVNRDWHIVADQKGRKGYAHSSWLDFTDLRLHRAPEDSKTAWCRYSDDVKKMLKSGPISNFISMTDYVDVCTKSGCKLTKEDQSLLGICAHDLGVLLIGSGCYGLEWIKERRNIWHPDRFARFCVPELAGPLKIKAQQLFVLHGILMEKF